MQFVVEKPVLDLFPTLTIGVVRGEIDQVRPEAAQALRGLQTKAEAALVGRGVSTEGLGELPHVALWREAYRAFGAKPKKHRPTHEAMARRILRDEGWPTVNLPVDIYLTNQIEHLLPHGGYDADALRGGLRLTVTPAAEPFAPLGGGDETTEPGEVVYRDDEQVLTRRWNYRDADRTKITADTRRFLLMIESPSDALAADVATAVEDLCRRYEACFAGNFTGRVLNIRAGDSAFEV